MTSDVRERFAPISSGATGLFVDTSAWFARFYRRDEYHDDVSAFFETVLKGSSIYRPLYVNDYVIDELCTLLKKRVGHERAKLALETLDASDSVNVRYVGKETFLAARDAFLAAGSMNEASFTDVVIAEHAAELDVDHVLAYDGDFEDLGLVRIPHSDPLE